METPRWYENNFKKIDYHSYMYMYPYPYVAVIIYVFYMWEVAYLLEYIYNPQIST